MHSTSVVVVNQTLGRNKKWRWLNKVYKSVDDIYMHDSNIFLNSFFTFSIAKMYPTPVQTNTHIYHPILTNLA